MKETFICSYCGKENTRGQNTFGKYCNNKCQALHRRPALEDMRSPKSIRKLILEERQHMCEMCGNSEWLGKPITLEVDHVDGNSSNNTRANLRLLCPNCHSTTDTYKSRNKGKGRAYRMERYHSGLSF